MRTLLLFTTLFSMGMLSAQPTLIYKNHALKADTKNSMTYCSYSNPGEAGENVVWDFTGLKKIKSFDGIISEAADVDISGANTELNEFGTHFFYNVNKEGISQSGYKSNSGRTKIVYTTPFRKMVFPLNFNDHYITPFAGEYFIDDNFSATITGISDLHADAWGTVVLPGGVKFENTIRVKSVKEYTKEYSNSQQDIVITTYRWYNSLHRYPIVTLIESEVISSGGKISKSTQAAYNTNAVTEVSSEMRSELTDKISLSVYPNPAINELVLDLYSEEGATAKVYLTDITGKTVIAPFNTSLAKGENQISLTDKIQTLTSGNYTINVLIDNQLISKPLSLSR